jgi:hypothetical protein
LVSTSRLTSCSIALAGGQRAKILITSGIYKNPITILPIGATQTLTRKGESKDSKPWKLCGEK